MRKVLLIITALLLCGMPLCGSASLIILDEDKPDDPTEYGDPPFRPKISETVNIDVFNAGGELTYQGKAEIVDGNLLIDTTGWEKGTYTAYVKAESRAYRIFTIICE